MGLLKEFLGGEETSSEEFKDHVPSRFFEPWFPLDNRRMPERVIGDLGPRQQVEIEPHLININDRVPPNSREGTSDSEYEWDG